jgi:uncharacterized protein with GYD domain
MATYVTLIKFTERGVKDIKDTCKRAADFKSHSKKHGIEVKEQYWCMGAHDGLIIFDAPPAWQTGMKSSSRCRGVS